MTIVETASGKVQGTVEEGIHVFRGIPFAACPSGALRFKPPQPVEPWTGVRDATAFCSISLQNASPLETMFGSTAPSQAEDCLALNVWTPACDGAKRPVMVWIHGGAFLTGSGSTPWYDGSSFARLGDVVLVTINYRLGALGFLHLDDVGGEAYGGSGNAGILDQVAALEWVRDNIEAFGGDPANVTAFGESAGAMSVGTLLGLPSAKGLFVKAIPQSGAAHNAKPRDVADRVAREFLTELGLPVSADGVARLHDVPGDALLEAQNRLSMKYWVGGLAFTPVVDGIVLPEPPIDGIGNGNANGVSVLIGSNRDEMKLFTMLDPSIGQLDEKMLRARAAAVLGDESHADGLIAAYRATRPNASLGDLWEEMQSDHIFRIPAIRLAERQSGLGNQVFMYLFTWATPAWGGRLGSCHALEIPFVFNALDAPGANMFVGEVTDELRELARRMHTAWFTFARTGRPTADGLPDWPAYDAAKRSTMILDLEPEVVEDPGGADREAWAGLR